jgi:PKD repeat protein
MKHLKLTLLTLLLPLVAFAATPVIYSKECSAKGNASSTNFSFTGTTGKEECYQFQGTADDGKNSPNLVWTVTEQPPWLKTEYDIINRPLSSVRFRGTPTAGVFTLKLKATNADGNEEKTYTITVTDPASAPTISTASLSEGEVELYYSMYSEELLSTTDDIYARWSVISGTLPPGLEFYSNNSSGKGNISGYPTAAGTFTFTVKAENVVGHDTKQLSITIVAVSAVPELGYEYEDSNNYYEIEEGYEGSDYWHYISVNRIATLTITANSLPPGLEITNPYPGEYIIRGYPTKPNIYDFTLRATNSKGSDSKNLRITVNAATEAPEINKEYIYDPEVYVGKKYANYDGFSEYAAQLSSDYGGKWSATGLPPGLEFRGEGSQAYITGTPTKAGTYPVNVKVSNSAGNDEATFNIIVITPRRPQFEQNQTRDGRLNMSYSEGILADTEYAKYSIAGGSLPPGLSLDSDGYIHGTPTELGTFTFTVKAENVSGSATKQFTIKVIEPVAPTITTASLPNAKIGLRYYQPAGWYQQVVIEAADYATWSISEGSLPDGLQLGYCNNRNSCDIYGTPTATSVTSTFTVKAENSASSSTKQFTITVATPAPPQIADIYPSVWKKGWENGLSLRTKADLPNATAGDGDRAASWSITEGELPPGLSLDSDGYIHGTPTELGTWTFKVKATNAGGDSQEKELTIAIEESVKPVIATTSLPNGKVGVYYGQVLDAGDNATWSLASGDLPPGLNLDSDGYIYGTPTRAVTYEFTVKATNDAGSDTKRLTIAIASSGSSGGYTPVLSKAETGNKAVHIANGLNLSVSSGAVVGIYGLKGNLVLSQSYASGEHTMSMNNLPKGMYIVKVSFRNRENTISHSDVMRVMVK